LAFIIGKSNNKEIGGRYFNQASVWQVLRQFLSLRVEMHSSAFGRSVEVANGSFLVIQFVDSGFA